MPYVSYYGWRSGYSLKEPWDGPNNRNFDSLPYNTFQCPSVDSNPRSTVDYVAVVGPDTMWPGRDRVGLHSGNRDTILLIEMPDSDYRCLEPRFPTVEEFWRRSNRRQEKGFDAFIPRGLPT